MLRHLRQLLQNDHTRPVFLKTLAFFVLFGITFYGAYGMAKSFYSVHKQKTGKTKELTNIQERLDTINSESTVNDDFQKEKVLREKLHMVRPGEDLIIIVPDKEEPAVKK